MGNSGLSIADHRRRARMLLSVLALVCGSSASGCSFIFVEGPPPKSEWTADSPPVDCTDSEVVPVIDTLIAAFQVVRTGYALSASDADYEGFPLSRSTDAVLGIGFASLFASSAITGYLTTSACDDAKEAQAHDRARRPREPEHDWAGPPARPTPPIVPSPTASGCGHDGHCKGERICVDGQCQFPPSQPKVAPPPPQSGTGPDSETGAGAAPGSETESAP